MDSRIDHPLKPFARTGYAARGLIYIVIGFFAALAAVGSGETMDSKEALTRMLSSEYGSIIAVVLIIGLAAFALWRLLQAVFDCDHHGFGLKGSAVRIGLLASCVTYSALAIYTTSLWRGAGSDDHGSTAETMAGFIGQTASAALLAAIFAGVAIAHFIKAWKRGYAKYLEASDHAMKIIDPISRAGLVARGLTFAIISWLFAFRAMHAGGENKDVGLADALDFVVNLPAGQWLLGAMGVGLICFAGYSLAEAAFRRINVDAVPLADKVGSVSMQPSR